MRILHLTEKDYIFGSWSTKADMESRLMGTERGGDQGTGAGRRGWENGESSMETVA